MKVGYVSELNLRGLGTRYSECVNRLVTNAKNDSINILVVAGGISNNYHISLQFVEDVGRQLRALGIKFRFLIGNTDLYYPKDESVIDKQKKFNEVLRLYRQSEYYLPYNPIFTRSMRILGAETWYDYSLYRGEPRSLKSVTRKKHLWYRNKDNDYITGEDDYSLGLKDTFDYRYTRECDAMMRQRLNDSATRHGKCTYNIVVTYFKASKSLLGNSYIDKYSGTFDGSSSYGDIMKSFHVTHCIYGKSPVKDKMIDNIRYIGVAGRMVVEDYD